MLRGEFGVVWGMLVGGVVVVVVVFEVWDE